MALVAPKTSIVKSVRGTDSTQVGFNLQVSPG
jgi:hypothetical protein